MIDLSSNQGGGSFAKAMAIAIKGCATLTQINLRANGLGSDAAKTIAQVCRRLPGGVGTARLRARRKATCRRGWQLLTQAQSSIPSSPQAIAIHHALTAVDLSSNSLNDECAKALGPTLKRLRRLDLSDNSLDAPGSKELANSLRASSSIEVLSLKGNIVGLAGAGYLSDAIRDNNSLIELKCARSLHPSCSLAIATS